MTRQGSVLAGRNRDRSKTTVRHLENNLTIRKGAWHFRPKLFRRRRKLSLAGRADEFDFIRRQFDILGSGNHELFAAFRTVSDNVIHVATGREAQRAVRAFKSKWHKRSGWVPDSILPPPRSCTGKVDLKDKFA